MCTSAVATEGDEPTQLKECDRYGQKINRLALEITYISIALISITESIRKFIDNNEFGCGIFINLKKAFDTVNRAILLTKLNHYGIRGVVLDWLKSYLSKKKTICKC